MKVTRGEAWADIRNPKERIISATVVPTKTIISFLLESTDSIIAIQTWSDIKALNEAPGFIFPRIKNSLLCMLMVRRTL